MSLSIYIHLPYCIKKCPFCDFNSYGAVHGFPENEYINSLVNEIKRYEIYLIDNSISSIYFGGGTPSLFSPDSIDFLINVINRITPVNEQAEVTIEVNPKTADYNKFYNLRMAGVNRVSLGVQSFSSRKLKILGRLNDPDDNYRTIDDIKRSNISNINIDLMYGIPDETFYEWSRDLECTAALLPKHISAYCLTIENGTEFHKRYNKGDLILPDEDTLITFGRFTSDFLCNKEFIQYEISNYSVENYRSVHNTAYWKGEDYIGFGAGAHSHLKRTNSEYYGVRWSNYKNPSKYMSQVSKGLSPVEYYEKLTQNQSFQDSVMMGLRLIEGIDTLKLKSRYGIDFNYEKLKHLFDLGYIYKNKYNIALTGKGIMLSNYIISELVEGSFTI